MTEDEIRKHNEMVEKLRPARDKRRVLALALVSGLTGLIGIATGIIALFK